MQGRLFHWLGHHEYTENAYVDILQLLLQESNIVEHASIYELISQENKNDHLRLCDNSVVDREIERSKWFVDRR